MKYAPNVVEDWIERVNDEAVNLTPWETQFMESLTDQWERTRWISEKQLSTLEDIYTEKVP
jgi:hypothetical protein